MRARPLDIAIVALALAATVFVSARVYGGTGGEATVLVSAQDGEWAFPLARDLEFPVKGPLGMTVVHIHGGVAAIESSPCPNKTCVLAGSIERPGQWVACLPNKVFVRIEGRQGSGALDGATW